jgi:hypothetical protein
MREGPYRLAKLPDCASLNPGYGALLSKALTLCCRPRESGDPVFQRRILLNHSANRRDSVYWVPAFAGTTAERFAKMLFTIKKYSMSENSA